MKMILFIMALIPALLLPREKELIADNQLRSDSLLVMFWNLENFFDWRNDSTSVSDADFSSHGARHWTRRRFYTKCNAISKAILWIASQEGALPDVIGLAEVENAFVLSRLLRTTALEKLDYKVIHFDSPDRRGIDTALLYRESRLELADARPRHLYADSTVMQTRDILIATFICRSGDSLAVLVNHHPSKYGGSEESALRRQIAIETLKMLADSLKKAGLNKIIAIGDFNDTPDNPLYEELLEMENLSLPLHRAGFGSIRYDGQWELIDLCFTLGLTESAYKIIYIPFLMVPDKASGGLKPLRTYSGPKYIGGVSDHCPVILKISSI